MRKLAVSKQTNYYLKPKTAKKKNLKFNFIKKLGLVFNDHMLKVDTQKEKNNYKCQCSFFVLKISIFKSQNDHQLSTNNPNRLP